MSDKLLPFSLIEFIAESNRIEGIAKTRQTEIDAHRAFLAHPVATVESLVALVRVLADAPLRDQPGMNVRVGGHRPPPGGPRVREMLGGVLRRPWESPWHQHVAYEMLHPFMDGNGRSGRALWLHSMGGIECAPLGFLHHSYYQSLQHSEFRKGGFRG